ncbi:MAG: Short-chain dehydrogenase, associated with 2-hydroxychromene-2-carboxylate isomerase family protein [uncultured Rubrobacteraceae bacterium]|uniref:Short-chain dehydrogenase, associated with 2-hydroxychromene-2-carboxylate isomerase family protein n=1 Tax=uncultured Rubrobacteraceae bacterium TaxID=349277 RepID=A0A6J4PF76_9ACTN|nr:MAG: Short-chain dehydrogenase, associated with 2-hydroxychromene-2-carboxylate isomerase family protein [uncultured Rubrobacteraceae bacterium]
MNGKTAAVLGVGPGLGAAVARRFAREGFAVALMARREESVAGVQEEIESAGGTALTVSADATDPASVAAAFDRVRAELGEPEVFVYNAGAFQMGGILEISPEKFDECFKANCAGAFYAAQQVLPAMVEAGRGTVLLTGATAALRGGARFSALAVGKFGLRALAQSMAREFGPQGIHVAHAVIDGQIDTPGVREMSPGREDHTMLSPDAIAEAYWQLHSQDRTAWTLELDLRPAVESF